MALLLRLLPEQYFEGLVTRYLGDRWELECKVVNRVGSVDMEVDLTGGTASAYFPVASGGVVAVEAELSQPDCGRMSLVVPPEITENLEENLMGIPLYATLEDIPGQEGPVTVQTPTPDFVIAEKNEF